MNQSNETTNEQGSQLRAYPSSRKHYIFWSTAQDILVSLETGVHSGLVWQGKLTAGHRSILVFHLLRMEHHPEARLHRLPRLHHLPHDERVQTYA